MGVKQRNDMQDSDPTPQNTDEGKDQETTSFSQEQVNEIVSKRLAEANSKAEKRLKDEVSKALAEAERQSKLSEAEREKEFKAKQEADHLINTIVSCCLAAPWKQKTLPTYTSMRKM